VPAPQPIGGSDETRRDRRMNRRRAAGPSRRGMGQLESQILDVLWDDGGRLTPSEVGARLHAEQELAYTTVMTVLTRLYEKGVLSRERRGRAWAYQPVLGRAEHTAERMNDILHEGGDQSKALARFVDQMTPAERQRLRKLLDSRGPKS
jgi:predicted transcriptional regulator